MLRHRGGHGRFAREYSADEHFFDRVDTEAKAYFLGLLTADGCVHGTNRKPEPRAVSLNLKRNDEPIIHRFLRALRSNARVGRLESPRAVSRVTIHSQILAAALMRHGVLPRKSLIVEPARVPQAVERHYWRGLVDGDGSLSARNDRCSEIHLAGTKAICRGFLQFANAQGVQGGCLYRKQRSLWIAKFAGREQVWRLARLLYTGTTVALERKAARAREIIAEYDRRKLDGRLHLKRGWTPAYLTKLRKHRGSWTEVARHLGVSPQLLLYHRKRLGMTVSTSASHGPVSTAPEG